MNPVAPYEMLRRVVKIRNRGHAQGRMLCEEGRRRVVRNGGRRGETDPGVAAVQRTLGRACHCTAGSPRESAAQCGRRFDGDMTAHLDAQHHPREHGERHDASGEDGGR